MKTYPSNAATLTQAASKIMDDNLPAEALMDLDDLAALQLVGSIEYVLAGCPTPEPPEAPAFPLAA